MRAMFSQRVQPGFTLIELLVVVAIISILAAILFPVFAQAKAASKQSVCLAQIGQLSLATVMYASDFEDTFPSMLPLQAPVNGGGSQIRPFDTMIAPYVKSDNLYACPNDSMTWAGQPLEQWWDGSYWPKRRKRSYAIIGNVFTVEGGIAVADPNTGVAIGFRASDKGGRTSSQFDEPAATLSFAEVYLDLQHVSDSWMGEYAGASFLNCDTAKLPGRSFPSSAPSDQLPCPSAYRYDFVPQAYHSSGENFAYVDGHCRRLGFS